MKKQKMRCELRALSVVALSAVTVAFGVADKRAAIVQGPDEAAVHEALLKSASAF